MWLRSALIASAILISAPAPALAGWRLDRAVAVANAVWGNPCPWRVVWSPPPPRQPGAIAWASMEDGCRYVGAAVVYLSDEEPTNTFDVFCTRVLHERGHTVGAAHSDNPRSIMYPEDQTVEIKAYSDDTHFKWIGHGDPRCRDRGRPYLESRGLLQRRLKS